MTTTLTIPRLDRITRVVALCKELENLSDSDESFGALAIAPDTAAACARISAEADALGVRIAPEHMPYASAVVILTTAERDFSYLDKTTLITVSVDAETDITITFDERAKPMAGKVDYIPAAIAEPIVERALTPEEIAAVVALYDLDPRTV